MAKFEIVSRYADAGLSLPVRKTADSAGYDLCAAEDILIPSFQRFRWPERDAAQTLSEIAAITKNEELKPTLVPTGIKCQLNPATYLQLSVRSSLPLKHWLILGNGCGIIDRDYWNNNSNEGEIFIQLINLSPYDVLIKKGEPIAQAIILPYATIEDDNTTGVRSGGFGSTGYNYDTSST